MIQKCPDCKNKVDVPEGFKIDICLTTDHWFEPISSRVEEVEVDYIGEIIRINPKPFLKMCYYTKAGRGEVSGFGKVRRTKDGYVVTDVKIFKQECNGASTVLDSTALAQFIYKLTKRGGDPNDWKLWWHSHADMGVFFSGTDESTIRGLSKDTTLLSICINKNGETLGRIDEDGVGTLVKVVCTPRRTGELWNKCKSEVEKKITPQIWEEVKQGWNQY